MVSVKLLRFFNKYLLSIILIFLYPFRFLFFSSRKKGKKVLVIRLWALGDCINLLPIVKKLDDEGYKVDVLTTKNVVSIFENQKFIKDIVLFNFSNPFSLFGLFFRLRKSNYSIVIDTEQFLNVSTILGFFASPKKYIGYNHLFRGKFYNCGVKYVENKHFVDNFFSLIKVLDVNVNDKDKRLVALNYTENSEIKVDKLLSKFNGKRFIGIHLGTGGTAKGRRWDVKKFCELVNKISEKYDDVVIVFTGQDDEMILYDEIKDNLRLEYELNLINKLKLSDLVYLFSKLDLFVCNDTGPMHMAAAMKTRVIGLFGMNNPKKVGAWPLSKNINMYKNPDQNVIINNKYSIYPSDECSTIDLISVCDVYKEVEKELK